MTSSYRQKDKPAGGTGSKTIFRPADKGSSLCGAFVYDIITKIHTDPDKACKAIRALNG